MLHSYVAHVVTAHIVGVLLHVGRRDFPDVAEDIGSAIVVVFPKDAFLDIKPREAVELLLQTSVLFGRKVGKKFLW